ncbi:MAG: alpha/beta hydrolase [Propionibacteriaceae bacterium]|nr:alpha/beta hydrolase [Propionibacteriaceae bacterium]
MDTPLLVFLHGPGQSPPVWQDVVGAINPEQPMAAPWLKGLKPGEHGGFHMDQAVAAVADLMETRGAERADLVGYSLGGLVAVRTALAYPEKIAHLVLVSTPAVLGRTLITSQRMIAKLTPARMFKGVGKEQVLAALDAMLEADITADLAKLTTPVLAVIAENDTAGLASMEQMARDAHATTRQLPGSDPNLLATHPAVLARLISDFCADFLDDTTPANQA